MVGNGRKRRDWMEGGINGAGRERIKNAGEGGVGGGRCDAETYTKTVKKCGAEKRYEEKRKEEKETKK
jgi:hypothetical protein